MRKNEVSATATANNANNGSYLMNALHTVDSLGYALAYHAENEKGAYELSFEKDVDGEKTKITALVKDDDEKRAIDELDVLANIDTYKPAKQCALFAFIEEKGTWKNYGVKFSAYAQSINPRLSDNTIRGYLNVGKCFMKAGTTEPTWVDERLKGVSISNLSAVISTFKAYADHKELDGAKEYRDYVAAFLDEYIDTEKIHLQASTQQVKDECCVLAGRETSSDRKAKKESAKSEPTAEKLTDGESLILALKNYVTGKPDNEKAYELAVALLQALTPPTDISNANDTH